MIRFYANQAGYLPKGCKIAVLAQENRADEMEKPDMLLYFPNALS